ncbi:hypothetical protein EXIGLDRAFT_783616 [Exidia glandulosa HHB12029]|uniref:EthD domain-containing protein n=1 Tax=Exidia glandulosa HHB12029 TaxID=1314781 RepID=A0A165Z1J8_EXIGL|nr:hypothetical protein EXIGLDRAFT_783616 [Exidia glandulosa HHB12029]
MAIPTGSVRMIGLIAAKDGMTHEEFTKRWLKHGELIRSMEYVQKNILKYEQSTRPYPPSIVLRSWDAAAWPSWRPTHWTRFSESSLPKSFLPKGYRTRRHS